MFQQSTFRKTDRRGFTLIEMLVVILIIMLLAGLVMAFMPGVSARQQSERGGLLLRTALNQTKQNARRDSRAGGIRLISNPTNPNFCTNPVFIQKPDDFGGGTASCAATNLSQVTLAGADMSATPIAAGDAIEIGFSGLPHTISPSYTPQSLTLPLNSPLMNPITVPTAQYRIMRAPRLMIGEAPIALPQDVGIDITLGGVFATGTLSAGGQPTSFAAAGSGDILFSPSGQVVGAFTGCDAVVLWVRDMVVTTPTSAFPVLVVIYGKSGFVTQQPVNPTGDAYQFVRAALSSGM